MAPVDWAHVAGAFESAVTGLAALAAGAWALFTFKILKKVDNELAERQQTKEVTRKTAAEATIAEQKLNRRAGMALAVKHAVIPPVPGVARALLCTVSCHNQGNDPEVLSLKTMKLVAVPVQAVDGQPACTSGQGITALPAYDHALMDALALHSNEKTDFAFVLFLPAPGVYLLRYDTESFKKIVDTNNLPPKADDTLIELLGAKFSLKDRITLACSSIASIP